MSPLKPKQTSSRGLRSMATAVGRSPRPAKSVSNGMFDKASRRESHVASFETRYPVSRDNLETAGQCFKKDEAMLMMIKSFLTI